MAKSPDAFRTIGEVASWLDVPTHVLRFWESRFAQVKPVKRAGGRRYYRRTDMELLGGLKRLLHEENLSIREVKTLLREEGVRHVAAFSQPIDLEEEDVDNVVRMPRQEQWSPNESAEMALEALKLEIGARGRGGRALPRPVAPAGHLPAPVRAPALPVSLLCAHGRDGVAKLADALRPVLSRARALQRAMADE